MKQCPACGTANEDDSHYCKSCGAGFEPGTLDAILAELRAQKELWRTANELSQKAVGEAIELNKRAVRRVSVWNWVWVGIIGVVFVLAMVATLVLAK